MALEFDLLYEKDSGTKIPTMLAEDYFINGEIRKWTGDFFPVRSPIFARGKAEPIILGKYPMLTPKESLEALDASVRAFKNGSGEWPTLPPKDRIYAVARFLNRLKDVRNKIVDLIMWEICKNLPDAQKEVDRTMKYISDTIASLKE